MWVTVSRTCAGLPGKVPVTSTNQALTVAEPALVEGAVGIAELSRELHIRRVVFNLRGVGRARPVVLSRHRVDVGIAKLSLCRVALVVYVLHSPARYGCSVRLAQAILGRGLGRGDAGGFDAGLPTGSGC